MPKATIVVPAFNVSATLPETLKSLLAQDHPDFEILVVDDGSHDSTPAIAAEFAEADPRVRVIRQANRGLAGARNTGIAEARGDYIGFCDADDLWLPGKLSAHVRHLDANPQVGISYSGSALIDDDGKPTGIVQSPKLAGITAAHVFQRNPIGNGSSPVMRRAAVLAISWRPEREKQRDWVFDETFSQSEDIECWLRLMLTTDWQIAGVPGALVQYRVNGAGLSAATDRQLASWERMVSKLRPLSPVFFERQENAARAYQLRYLARRAVSSRDGTRARQLARRAMAQSLRPLFAEPAKTLTTVLAAEVMDLAGGRLLTLAETGLRRLRA